MRIATKPITTTPGEIYYFHGDHLGSTSVVTDKTGAAIGEYVYRPFGETYAESGTHFRYLYTGQEQDFETGLYFYNARYYDARLARFISADTIVPGAFDPQALNRYSYALNNPLRYTDPTGHEGEISNTSDVTWSNSDGSTGTATSNTVHTIVDYTPIASSSVGPTDPAAPVQTSQGPTTLDSGVTLLPGVSKSLDDAIHPLKGKINYSGQTVRNPYVRNELAKLRAGLDVEGYSNIDLVVTGGESYYDAAAGRSISLTDGSVIPKRGSGSAHHIEYGARDVDVRRVGIPDADFKSVVRTYTNFDRMGNDYSDGHWHLGLPHTYNCPPGVCRR